MPDLSISRSLSRHFLTLSPAVNRDRLEKRVRQNDTSLEQSPVVKAPCQLEYLLLQCNNEQVVS